MTNFSFSYTPGSRRRSASLGAGIGLLFLAFVSASLAFAAGDSNKDFSQANRLLFMTDHLRDVDAPGNLKYTFSRQGGNDTFDDRVELEVMPGEQGKNVHIDFLSGKRNRFVPDISDAHGNPVIMLFLQRDISEIARRTGGSWRYFQRRIKSALANNATVQQETADYNGQTIDVRRIYLSPFTAETAHRRELADEVHKRYVFTLSDQVPGGVLEMRSEVALSAAKENGAGKTVVERLALGPVNN